VDFPILIAVRKVYGGSKRIKEISIKFRKPDTSFLLTVHTIYLHTLPDLTSHFEIEISCKDGDKV